jgi:hypothetical protein
METLTTTVLAFCLALLVAGVFATVAALTALIGALVYWACAHLYCHLTGRPH